MAMHKTGHMLHHVCETCEWYVAMIIECTDPSIGQDYVSGMRNHVAGFFADLSDQRLLILAERITAAKADRREAQ